MGTFRVGARIENIIDRSKEVSLSRMPVDTGSKYTWMSGRTLEELGVEREKKDLEFGMTNSDIGA